MVRICGTHLWFIFETRGPHLISTEIRKSESTFSTTRERTLSILRSRKSFLALSPVTPGTPSVKSERGLGGTWDLLQEKPVTTDIPGWESRLLSSKSTQVMKYLFSGQKKIWLKNYDLHRNFGAFCPRRTTCGGPVVRPQSETSRTGD